MREKELRKMEKGSDRDPRGRPQRLVLFDGESCGGLVFLLLLGMVAVGLLILFGGGG